jgi:hypothetical protein
MSTRQTTSATIIGRFPGNGVGIIEGSWDLPRSFQDVEVFGDKGSITVSRNRLELMVGNQREESQIGALPANRKDPVTYFMSHVRGKEPIDGMVSPEFNVDVMQIVEAARRSARSGKPVAAAAAVGLRASIERTPGVRCNGGHECVFAARDGNQTGHFNVLSFEGRDSTPFLRCASPVTRGGSCRIRNCLSCCFSFPLHRILNVAMSGCTTSADTAHLSPRSNRKQRMSAKRRQSSCWSRSL